MKISEIILGQGRNKRKRGPRPGWDKRIGFHSGEKGSPAKAPKVIHESGSMPGTGAIHIDEIKPTLQKLERDLGIKLMDNVLGSVGKKEFSGDIDIAIDIPKEKFEEFFKKLTNAPSIENVTKSSVFMTTVRIENYDPNKETDKPRTGKVQVDFMVGEPEWLKTYYHSPHEKDSRFKGVYRTTFLASLSSVYQREDSNETNEHGVPMESLRYKFSPTQGLVRVKRTPVPRKDGKGYTKKSDDQIIGGPWRTADAIAKQLNLGSGANLDSFETIHKAVKQNYSPEEASAVFTDFANSRQTQEMGVPDEIKDYVK